MSTIFWKSFLKCLPTTIPSSHPLPTKEEDETSTMTKNFNTVYDLSSTSTSKSLSTHSTNSSFSSDSDSDFDIDSPPDLATIFASQRFFFSSPGQSNSIIESPNTLTSAPEPQSPLSGGIAVKKYSPDPYSDFKHSMQEMIDARELRDVRADWDYLHELLSCYLTLNPENTHKFIVSAFADIVISLLSSSPSSPELVSTHQKTGDCRQINAYQ